MDIVFNTNLNYITISFIQKKYNLFITLFSKIFGLTFIEKIINEVCPSKLPNNKFYLVYNKIYIICGNFKIFFQNP